MTLYLGEHLSFCSAVPIFYRWHTPFYQQMFKQQRTERMLAFLSFISNITPIEALRRFVFLNRFLLTRLKLCNI